MVVLRPYINFETGQEGGGGGGADPAVAEQAEFQTLYEKGEANLSEEEKTKWATLKDKYEIEEVDKDGNPIKQEDKIKIQEIETKVNAILAKPEEQRTAEEIKYLEENTSEEEDDSKNIYEKVDEQVGETLDIDYGDVEPNSVEGIILREETIRENTVKKYEDSIKAAAPRAYDFLLHTLRGGKEEDFFTPSNEDFSKLTLKKEDLASQEAIYRKALNLKGNSPDEIDALVQTAKDSQNLFTKAKAELEALQSKQTTERTKREQVAAQAKREEDLATNKLGSLLEEKIYTKGFGGIKIPAADKDKFFTFIGDNLSYNRGKFLVTRSIDVNDIDNFLKAEYFAYKKGDLNGVVARKEQTKRVLKIKQDLEINKKVIPKGAGASSKKRMPLGDL